MINNFILPKEFNNKSFPWKAINILCKQCSLMDKLPIRFKINHQIRWARCMAFHLLQKELNSMEVQNRTQTNLSSICQWNRIRTIRQAKAMRWHILSSLKSKGNITLSSSRNNKKSWKKQI